MPLFVVVEIKIFTRSGVLFGSIGLFIIPLTASENVVVQLLSPG